MCFLDMWAKIQVPRRQVPVAIEFNGVMLRWLHYCCNLILMMSTTLLFAESKPATPMLLYYTIDLNIYNSWSHSFDCAVVST